MKTYLFEVVTGRKPAVLDLSKEVAAFCRYLEGDGLLSVFTPHSTCGLAVMEIGSRSDQDLIGAMERILPRPGDWRHRHGSPGHGADHVLPALVSPSLTIPILDGHPATGVWQSVVLVDPNRDNPVRTVRLSFVAA